MTDGWDPPATADGEHRPEPGDEVTLGALRGDIRRLMAQLREVEEEGDERWDGLRSRVETIERGFGAIEALGQQLAVERAQAGAGPDSTPDELAAASSPASDRPADPTRVEQADPGSQPAEPAPIEPLPLPELLVWVGEYISSVIARKLPQTGGEPQWCRRWWLHDEAVARFRALHLTWLEARVTPGSAMVVFYEHLDAMLGQLCAENGPFTGCRHSHAAAPVPPLGQDEPDDPALLPPGHQPTDPHPPSEDDNHAQHTATHHTVPLRTVT
jgi:hypothetical protein